MPLININNMQNYLNLTAGSRGMKIAIFTDTFFPNIDGVVTSLMNSSQILAQKGHKLLIIAPEYEVTKKPKLHKNVTIVRMKSKPLPTYKDFRYVFPCYSKCLKEIESFKPDLIHIETYSTLGWTGAKVARKLDLPSIGTYHTIAAEFVKYVSPISLLGIDKSIEKLFPPKSGTTLPPKKENFTKKLIWQYTIKLYNQCDIVTTPSPAMKTELVKRGLKKKVIFISNGIRTELYPLKSAISKKPRKLIHAGRLSYEKKTDILIYAFKQVLESIPDAKLTIVGAGPSLDSLKKLSEELNISDKILFTGFVTHKQLVKYYQDSDIFLTASPMETQGLVLLEAMSCGLPAIGVDRFAIPNVVHNGKNGFIAKGDYVKSIAKHSLELLNSPKLLAAMSKLAVKESKKHELMKCVTQLEDIYKSLVKSKK